jgi:small conductance mechanosensitive channel
VNTPTFDSLADELAALLARAAHLDGPVVGVLSRILVIGAALLVAWLAYRAACRLVDRLLRPLEDSTVDYGMRVQRARTLSPLLKNIALYLLAFLVVVAGLRELGVDVRALLLSAGFAGLAVGLGAQSLIKDVITGFFILFEGLIGVGDVIEVGGHTGTVEAIGLRVTKLRMFNGAQRVIPNGELTQFANYNKGWARAVVDVTVDHGADVAKAVQVLEAVGAEWARETGQALETPQTQSIMSLGEAGVGLRLHAKVDAARRLDAELELRRRIKAAFERESIAISTAQRVVYIRER